MRRCTHEMEHHRRSRDTGSAECVRDTIKFGRFVSYLQPCSSNVSVLLIYNVLNVGGVALYEIGHQYATDTSTYCDDLNLAVVICV